MARISEDDRGKTVVDETGEKIGVVSDVSGDRVHVDIDPGITDQLKAKLGWGDTEGDYVLDAERIDMVTDDEVRLGLGDTTGGMDI